MHGIKLPEQSFRPSSRGVKGGESVNSRQNQCEIGDACHQGNRSLLLTGAGNCEVKEIQPFKMGADAASGKRLNEELQHFRGANPVERRVCSETGSCQSAPHSKS
jgi:hypothetical protein